MGERKPTRNARDLMDLLDGNGTTVREAQEALGMTEVRSRISELVKAGVPIQKKWEPGFNKFGKPVRYIRYFLEDEL